MTRGIRTAALIGVAMVCLSNAAPGARGNNPYKVVCGKVSSIGAPKDVHATSQFFGFALDPSTVKEYPPGSHTHDWNLGVMRDDRDAIGLAFTLSAAYSTGGIVTIWYRPAAKRSPLPDTAACVLAQRSNKCPDIPPDQIGKCIDQSGEK